MNISIQTISSFPPISNQQNKSQNIHNPKISVLAAFNKLKQTQSRIVEASNKQAVKKRLSEAAKAREQSRQQSSAYKESIRKSIQMDKTMRQKSLQQRMKQQTKLHQLAITLRQTRYKFREQIKSAFRQSSSQIYQQSISQRQKNEQLIRQLKQREMLLKQQNRMKMAQKLQKSRQKVKEFRQSRVSFIKRQRGKDVEELERKIMARSRYLERLGDSRNNNVSNKNESLFNTSSRRSQSFTLNPQSRYSAKNNQQQSQTITITN